MALAAPELNSPAAGNQPGWRIHNEPVLFSQCVFPESQHHQLCMCVFAKMFEGLDGGLLFLLV